MEMWMVALLLGLSLTLILTAHIAGMRNMSHKLFLRFGVCFCVAAGTPFFYMIILEVRKDPESLIFASVVNLASVVFDLIAAFTSKEDVIPPCVPVKRLGQGRVARAAEQLALYLVLGFVSYFAIRWPFPSIGPMSALDTLACGFFAMAAVIRGFQSLTQGIEICGNGLLDKADSRPMLKPWVAFGSFSWTGINIDGLELRLQARSEGQSTTPLLVRPEDREVVQHILEGNVPNQLSGAHDGLNRRILHPCIRVGRTRRRRLAWHIGSAMCWPAVVLLLVYLWVRGASLETFSGVGFVSIMVTLAVNSLPPEIIEICRNGLLLGHKLRAWDQYECFFWKGETEDGIELWLQERTTKRTTRLVVHPGDREAAQQLLEAHLQDRSTDSEAYSRRSLF